MIIPEVLKVCSMLECQTSRSEGFHSLEGMRENSVRFLEVLDDTVGLARA